MKITLNQLRSIVQEALEATQPVESEASPLVPNSKLGGKILMKQFIVRWTSRGGYGERSGYTAVDAANKQDARKIFLSPGYMPFRPDEKIKVDSVELH